VEVVVDSRVRYTRLAGDVADGGAGEAALREEAQRRIQDLLTGMRSAARAAVARGVFYCYGEGPSLSSH